MQDSKLITRLTRGHQITIPKAVREKLGLRIGDLVEVIVSEADEIIVKKIPMGEPPILRWGHEFGKLHNIKESDIIKISRAVRREVFKDEYE